jgi:hypothetical protein
MSGPPALDLNQVKVGAPRNTIISVLGSPKTTEKQNDMRTDMHEFVDGYSAESKSRVILYIVGDFFFLGLTELIFWPIELGIGQGIEGRAVITYGPDNVSKSILMTKMDGSLWPGREAPVKSSEQPPVTVTPGIGTGAPKQPVPQSESGKEIAYVPKESIEKRKMISLRSKPDENFSQSHYRTLLQQYNFFDNTLNKYGSFQNDFVDNGNGTITDRSTGLMWQQKGSSREIYLIETEKYIEKLNRDRFAGYSDWRIPTTDEIVSLMKQTKKSLRDLHIDPLFDKKQYSCWSSDVGICNLSTGHYNAWVASFEDGIAQPLMTRNSFQSGTGATANPEWRSISRYVRAVRSITQSNP